MRTAKLKDMKKGWFIGNFEPTLLKTNDCEVAVKEYKAGDYEEKHYHRIATEFTLVLDGTIRMFGQEFEAGDIIVAEPGDATDFSALTDARNVVVKIPGANNDKYICEGDEKC